MGLNFRRIFSGLNLVPTTPDTTSSLGDLQVNSVDSKLYFHNGTSSSALLTESSSGDITNKNLVDTSVFFVDSVDNTKQIRFDASGTTGTYTMIASSQTANRTITLPDATTTMVGTNNTQTLTNKTIVIADNAFTLQDNSDATKQGLFDLSGITTGTTRTLLFPDANTTIVGTDATQTLTNKTYSIGSTPATTESVRFANNSGLAWRNSGNTGNVTLKYDSGDSLAFSGSVIKLITGSAAATDADILLNRSDSTLRLIGNNSGGNGAQIRLTGSTASLANNTAFVNAGTQTGSIDSSGLWTIGTSGGSQLHVVEGGLSVSKPLNLVQNATPSNPAAGSNKLYFKTDNILYQLTSAGVESAVSSGALVTIAARYNLTGASATTSLTASTDTILDFNSADYDTNSAVTTGAAWKFTAPRTDKYRVSCTFSLNGNTYGALNRALSIRVKKNGTTELGDLDVWRAQSTGGNIAATVSGSTTVSLTSGDYIQIIGLENDGTISINTGNGACHVSIESINNT